MDPTVHRPGWIMMAASFSSYMTIILSPTSILPQSFAASCCQVGLPILLLPNVPKKSKLRKDK